MMETFNMDTVEKEVTVLKNLTGDDLAKVRSTDAVIACDFFPLDPSTIQVMPWDEALKDGYDEPSYENNQVLVLDNDEGSLEIKGNKYHQVSLVIHESFHQRP